MIKAFKILCWLLRSNLGPLAAIASQTAEQLEYMSSNPRNANLRRFLWLSSTYLQQFLSNSETLAGRGGESGRATAFCPSEPVSNPGTNLAFFGNAFNLFSLGVGLSLNNGS